MSRSTDNAQRCLDLDELPRATRFQLGLEKVLLLKEILDRVEIPPWEEIPGQAEVAEKELTRWTIPVTELTIARMEGDPRAGEFLFSADTVRRLEEYYDIAQELPYKAGATEGVYELYLYGPGPLIPLRWVRILPEWLRAGLFFSELSLAMDRADPQRWSLVRPRWWRWCVGLGDGTKSKRTRMCYGGLVNPWPQS